MLIRKKTYEPMILTIPDDAALFSVLCPWDKITEKIVMENYINFYCYKDPETAISFFRFEDFRKQEGIEGLESCSVPLGLMQRNDNYFDFLLELLAEDYFISMPVVKECIHFYGKKAWGTHVLFIYGVETSRKFFLCKDFSGQSFIEFIVPFDAMKNSLENYNVHYSKERGNLFAFRIDRKAPSVVEYAKVYEEFHKLSQDFVSQEAGFGLGAIDLYIREVKQYPQNRELIGCWYVLGNYLREGAKLMKYRYGILEKELSRVQEEIPLEGERAIQKMMQHTEILFFKICRLRSNGVIVDSETTSDLADLVRICREDFRETARYFCRVIPCIK